MRALDRIRGVTVAALLGALALSSSCASPASGRRYGAGFPAGFGGGSSGGGGISSVSTSAPVSGDGTSGTPVTIATGAIGTTSLAANAVTTAKLATTAVSPGSYTHTSLTVGADGRITAASNGTPPGVTVVQTQTVSGSDANTITFSGLNGDSDNAIYEIDVVGVCGVGCTSAGGVVAINFNAVTTNQRAVATHIQPPSSITAFVNDTVAVVGLESAAGKAQMIHLRVNPKSGNHRIVEWFNALSDSSTSSPNQVFQGFAYWYDSATNITSIQLKDSTHNFFGIGTVATLRKVSL